MKTVLAILSRPPYAGAGPLETLEAAMVTQAFDLPTTVLFRGSAVNALRRQQADGPHPTRTVGKVVSALPTYEIEAIRVCQASLDNYCLQADDLVLPIDPIAQADIGALIRQFDIVMAG